MQVRKLDFFISIFLVVALFATVLCSVVVLGSHQITHSSFWFDEAGQIWLALGLHHFSPPNSSFGGLREIWQQSSAMSLDPGGFSFLLRGWMELFGKSATSIRALPYLFFILSVICLGTLSFLTTKTVWIALLTSLTIFLFPFCLHYAFEVRPYSMEYLGVLLGGVFLLGSDKMAHTRSAIVLGPLGLCGLCISCFMFSRYGFAVFSAGLCASFLFLAVLRQLQWRNALAFVVPVSITAALVYSLRFYGKSIGIPKFNYDQTLIALSGEQIVLLLKRNFLSLEVLPLTVTVVIGFFRMVRFRRVDTLEKLAIYVFFSHLVAIVLSLLGKMPWDLSLRWSLPFLALSAACLTIIASRLLLTAQKFFETTGSSPVAKVVLASLAIYLSQLAYQTARNYNREHDDNSAAMLQPILSNIGETSKLFVPNHMEATVRYHFELGSFREVTSGLHYPDHVIYESQIEGLTLDQEAISYAVFGRISLEELAEYQAKIGKSGRVVSEHEWPNRVLKF